MNVKEVAVQRMESGKELEGYAFTFCKAAFLALLFSKYTFLVTASAAVLLYIAAYACGVRELAMLRQASVGGRLFCDGSYCPGIFSVCA
ncbi:MAG: hypothetical protein GIW98_01580 [Candidatus Eremiobacteraeota bacterium]|nr:hypothetical protein [Candidatus Eremiobacteraeota bacterium]